VDREEGEERGGRTKDRKEKGGGNRKLSCTQDPPAKKEPGRRGKVKNVKRYIHRIFINSNYSSITTQNTNKHNNQPQLPHSFHKTITTSHFPYLMHVIKIITVNSSHPHSFSSKSSLLTISSSHSFS
jgi:hypothetical protein